MLAESRAAVVAAMCFFAGGWIAGCGSGGSGGGAIRPASVKVSPTNGTRGVAVSAVVTAELPDSVDPASVGPDSIIVVGPSGRLPATLDAKGTTLTAIPSSLGFADVYFVTVSAGLRTVGGAQLQSPVSSQFTTTDRGGRPAIVDIARASAGPTSSV